MKNTSKHLRYDMLWHVYNNPEQIKVPHPQKVMKELGITYQHATPQSLGDQWWFWNCENIPDPLPEFLTPLNLDPMEQIGYGLSKEQAELIRDTMKRRHKRSKTLDEIRE